MAGPRRQSFTNPQGQWSEANQPEGTTTGGMVHRVTDQARELASSASEFAGQAKDKVQEWTSSAASTAGEAYDSFAGMIRRYPLTAILLGMGIGFLLAQAFRPVDRIADRMSRASY